MAAAEVAARRLVDTREGYSVGRESRRMVNMEEHRERYVVLPVAVLRRRGLSYGAIVTYGLLRDYAGEKGSCWPSIETLADDLGSVHRNTVHTYLTELADAGIITIERRGQGRVNVYHLTQQAPAAPEYAQPTVHDYAQPGVHNGQYAQPGVQLDAQHTVHPLKDEQTPRNKGRTTPNGVGADAPPAAQNHTPSPPSEKPTKALRSRPVLVKEQQPGVTWEGLPEDVAKVAAAWMGADSIRPQSALSEQIARYAAQASRLLDRGHPAAHLVGCLRALAKMKRDTGKRWKVTPEMLADRVGQWQEQNGHAPDFFEGNGHAGSNGAGSGPPWPSMPKGSIHDPETLAGRDVFIAHFKKPPWMMSREEAIAAGVLDVYEKRRT